MKRTLFITMLAAALFGSAYANTNYTTTPGAAQTNPPGYIYGTYADTGDVSGGSVEVFEVSAPEGYMYLVRVFGGYTETGDATGNTVTMNGGWVTYSVYCGYVYDSGDATGNTVTMNGGVVSDGVYGGYVYSSGKATDNTVTMTGGEVGDHVYGGHTHSGDATGNTVDMTGGVVDLSVFGGYSYSGNATENAVTINDGYVGYSVYCGYVYSSAGGNATGNTVTMTGGEVGEEVCGGYTYSGNATGNTVDMTGGEVGYNVYGGYTYSGNATENAVTINDGYVDNSVYGGKTYSSGDACGNTVTIADSTVGGEEVLSCIYGGYTEEGDANNNTVTVTGGQAEAIHGGEGNNANGNTVTVTDATIEYDVYGGLSFNLEGAYSGTANDNTVTMNGGQVGEILAAMGYSTIGNTVVMNGGQTESIRAGKSFGGENSGNTVVVTEGVVLGGIGGGYLYNDGELRDNRVYLVGKGATATIGGKQYTGGAGGIQAGAIVAAMADEEAYHYVSSGNSIDVYGTGTTAGMVGYMEALTFHLGDGLASAGTPMLTITDDGLNLVLAKLGFRGDDVTDWSKFEGKSITLVQAADNVTGVDDGTEVNITGEGGKTLATATLTLGSGNALVLNFSGVAPTGQTSYTANPGSPQTSAPDTIYGAYAETGDVTGGSAAVFEVATGGYESLGNVYGGYAKSGNVSGCTATMDSGSAEFVYGGYTESGDATGNNVTMTGGEVADTLYGGYTILGNAIGNTVNMNGGKVVRWVIGGYTDSGAATGNTVTMNGGAVELDVCGGYTKSGNVSGCTANMDSGSAKWVSGGYTDSGNATDNTVNITGGVVDAMVRGGTTLSGKATGNTVTMSGGEVGLAVMGANSQYGRATGNTVVMTGGSALDVYGAEAWVGNATDNTAIMTGGKVGNNVYGGYSYGGYSLDGEASGNTVRLVGKGASYTIGKTTYQGSEIAIHGGVYAGSLQEGGISENNTVHIHGTGIDIGGTIDDSQQLTFHLVQGQAGAPGTPMVTLGGALDLEGVELGFYGDAVTNWAAFEGKSITLVQAADNVTGVVDGTEVDIINEVGGTLATATLTLGSGNALVLTFSGELPGGQTSYTANPGSPQTSAPDTIYGAYAETGDVTGGSAAVFEVATGGYESLGNVYGGYAQSGSVSGCTATMDSGSAEFVYGGISAVSDYSESYDATDNTVTVNGGEVAWDVDGGNTLIGNATGNTVNMNGGMVVRNVEGGVSYVGNATGNTVNLSGGEVGNVFGGSTNDGDATGNTVSMIGGEVADTLCGGYTTLGHATDNTVTLSDGNVGWYLYGGYVSEVSDDGNATGNTVVMNGGEVGVDVYGGVVEGSGDATGNTVILNNGDVNDDVCAGLTYKGEVSGNIVMMTGGSVSTGVYGAYSYEGNATGNTVLMAGGSAGYVYGGGAAGVYAATGNTVTMTGGEVAADVYGGFTESGEATGNTVRLVGKGASYTNGKTTYQGSEIAIQGSVYAGYVDGGGVSSNNSVHIHGTGASIGGTIDFCQQLTFHLVQGQAGAPGTPMVTLGGALDLEGVELGFYGDAVTDWAAFEGKSITLVGMTSATITGLVTQTDPVDITDEAGNTVATATLTLSDDQTMLYLSDIQGVTPVPPPPPPVPTVGPDALDVTLVNSLWASSAYVREFVRLSGAQGYALKAGDTAVWGGGFGAFMHATGDRGFKSDGGGYGIGVRHAFSANTQAGISLGQGFGSYHNSGKDGATVHQRAILAAATASTRIGKDFSLGGHLAFGNVRNRADCRLDGATERARWNDNVFNLGARAAYDFHVTERTAITPFLGLDWMNGAHESFTGGYARHYSHGRLNELRMPVGVTVSTATEVGSTKLLPQLSVAYVPSLAQQLPHADVSGENGDYRVKGYAPGRNAFMFNAGMNVLFTDSWSAGAFYTLETRRHSVDQSVNASVRYTF